MQLCTRPIRFATCRTQGLAMFQYKNKTTTTRKKNGLESGMDLITRHKHIERRLPNGDS